MNQTTLPPYRETIACRHQQVDEFGDGWCGDDHDICDYIWRCGTCGLELNGQPCPEHAPRDVPGLQVIECTAEPPHSRTWVTADDGYQTPCPWCLYHAAADAHDGCEHSHHGRWRRWKVTHKVLHNLSSLGVLRSHGWKHGGGCTGCATGIRWGRNSYVLGWPRWKWRCLLAARHWPGEEVLIDMCGKCNPCGSCGSQTFGHRDDCPAVTG